MAAIEGPAIVPPPQRGFWRVGRWPDPFAFPPNPTPLPSNTDEPILGGGRFDDPNGSYPTLYCSTSAVCAYGETIAVFRRRAGLLEAIDAYLDGRPDPEYDPELHPGIVPDDYLSGRAIGWAEVSAKARFVDVAAAQTHRDAGIRLADLLRQHGLKEFDRGVVMTQDRRLTRPVGRIYYELRVEIGSGWNGIRYESRHQEGWECWAVWDPDAVLGIDAAISPISLTSPALHEAAATVGVELPAPLS